MEGICEELDEAKAEIEKLREECKRKAELFKSLKSTHRDQLVKSQEASSKIEKQAREIEEKDEEISVFKKTVDDLRRSLNEKESVIKHLNAANEKLRVDCDVKFKKWEEESLGLVLAIEEANGKSFDLEQQIRAYEEEVKGLKGSLLVSQRKCSEAENKDNRSKEVREREDVVLVLEDGKRKIEEQLKWKKEQFNHLEEAHRKLRDQFKASEKEWESEKSSLLDEICSLQTSLDSQTRISEDLQNRLRICNQALACEESKRKSLEVQLSDVQVRFENVFRDYEDAKSQLECLTEKRDEEIASLRHSLSKKETVLKEMEYQKRQMEQENEELQISLNEFQESQIQKASGSGSVAKLQNKLKCSEKTLKESTANLKVKEAKLNSQLEKVKQELNNHRSQLESKDKWINELGMELKQLREDNANLNAKEAERNSELERAKDDLIHYKSEVESRDVIIEELRMALEQIHTDSTVNLQAREVEWKSRLETTTGDLKRCWSQLESKDEAISDLKTEMEKLHEEYAEKLGAKEAEKNSHLEKVRNDLNNYRSLLESRDVVVRELRMELEQINGESTAQFEAQKAEWKSQEEMMNEELKKYRAQLETKDQALKELKMEMERQWEDYRVNISTKEAEGISQLEKVTNELINRRDASIEALRSELDEVRRDFMENLKSKEAEWKLQLEAMRSVMDDKDAKVKQLRTDLEDCHSLSLQQKLQNEEMSVMLLVLKNGIYAAQLKIAKENGGRDRSNREKEESISVMAQQLVTKNAEIDRLQNDVGKEREKISALLRRVESSEIYAHQQRFLLQKEIDMYEEMLVESSISELFVREQLLQNEGELRKKLESNEAEWKVMRSVLDDEEARVKKLRTDLEDSRSSSLELKLENEEISITLLVLKNGISEAQLKRNKEKEGSISVLSKQMEIKNADIDRLQKELEKCEEMFMESSVRELFVREQLLQNEGVLRKKLKLVCNELERANAELAEKIYEGNRMEFELYIWKSVAERFKAGLEEGFGMRKELESSLLAQVVVAENIELERQTLLRMIEEKNTRIDDLQQQVVPLEQNLRTREASASSLELEKSRYLQAVEQLEQESLRRELEQFLLAKIEEERIVQTNSEKVNNLMQLLESLEDKFNTSLISFSSQLAEKQAEINLVRETWDKTAASEIIAATEIEEKKLLIAKLEDDNRNLQHKLEVQQQSMRDLKHQASEAEAKVYEMKTKLENSDRLIEELKSERTSLAEDVTKLSSERENILGLIGRLDDTIAEFSSTDENLMDMLESMVISCDEHSLRTGLSIAAEKENVDSPTAVKKGDASSNSRSPFREINN